MPSPYLSARALLASLPLALAASGCSLLVDADSFDGESDVPSDAGTGDGGPVDASDGASLDAGDVGPDPCDPGAVEVVNTARLGSLFFVMLEAAAVPDGRQVSFLEPARFSPHGEEAAFEEGRARLLYDAFRPLGQPAEEATTLLIGEDECGEAGQVILELPVAPTVAQVSDPEGALADNDAQSVDVANDGSVVFASRASNLPQDGAPSTLADIFLREVGGGLRHLSPSTDRDAVNARIDDEGRRVAFSVRGTATSLAVVRVVTSDGMRVLEESHGCSSCVAGAPLAADLRGEAEPDLLWLELDPDTGALPRRLIRRRFGGVGLWLEVDEGFLDQPRIQPGGAVSVRHTTSGLLRLGRSTQTPPRTEPEVVDPEGITMAEAVVRETRARLVALPGGTRVEVQNGAEEYVAFDFLEESTLLTADDALTVWAGAGSATADLVPLSVLVRSSALGEPLFERLGTLPDARLVNLERGQLRSVAVSPDGRWLAYVDAGAEPARVVRVQLQD